ncbi:MAG TPA: tRNA (guanosine(37)-N1)-methyltransferase TrmD [Planktothrix sp.]|jgi:tRNA (guanine37-N1)-methyltransferase
MKFVVVTLFPDLIMSYCRTSIIGRGMESGKILVETCNPREFCTDKYRRVDDTPYGGGPGMVLKPEPMFAAVESIDKPEGSPVILMTPHGEPFKQAIAEELAHETHIVFICGHYEGFDERIRTLATREISLGDFVMTGGELAALTIIDAVGRLVPGVIGKPISLADESFVSGILEAPQYTKPAEFRGMIVPQVLRGGNHKEVALWRRREALRRTYLRRPDLLANIELNRDEQKFLNELKEYTAVDE